MAYEVNITDITVFGNKRIVIGDYETNAGTASFDLDTGLTQLQFLTFMMEGVNASPYPVITGEFEDGIAPVNVPANSSGFFMAYGL